MATNKPTVEPPQITILPDHPTGQTSLLGIEAKLAPLFDIMRHKNTAMPMAAAIYGDWGTGKTSAMKWLENELGQWNKQTKTERAGHPKIYTVSFYPWKYSSR